MGVTVRRSGGRLQDISLLGADLMREVGLLARQRIITRTRSGQDVSGGSFRPYSPAYAKAKQAALGTSTWYLEVSGQMLRDLGLTEVTETSVTLGWSK